NLILSHKNQLHSNLAMTHVSFKLLTEQEKNTYVREGLWKVDKPGAYDPLGYEARWIKSINGSHTNFIQVPSYELMNLLRGSGLLEESK
ncbi:MAG: Maf family protein, partial [Alphaproteobacteria bacterium]|nr:Maf family protein [Alphaproteobacteria bacterium]